MTALEAEIANWKDIAKQAHEAAEEANAQVKLERAAFARKAAGLCETEYTEIEVSDDQRYEGNEPQLIAFGLSKRILTLAQSDLPALDERDRETRDRALEEAAVECDKLFGEGDSAHEAAGMIRAMKGGSR